MKARLLTIFGVLIIGLVNGCKPSDKSVGLAPYFKTHFQDESQFIVETIISDLAAQMYYAKNHKLPEAKYFSVSASEKPNSQFSTPSYDVQINLGRKQQVAADLNVNGPIWSPEVYDAVATKLAGKIGLGNSVSDNSEDTELLEKLLDGTATTIEGQNQNLSKSLEDDFSNPVLHEEAAVLLGAFTLREHSGVFYEIRSPLCEMTAHLAMARYLGKNSYGINGQVAEAMLLTLMNNETQAMGKLNEIKTNNATLISWVRALQARNTGDYRPLENSGGLSQVECVEWFRALYRNANHDMAWSKLSDSQKQTIDFIRIASEGNFSVQLGHDLLDVSLTKELQEIASIYDLEHNRKIENGQLVKALNQMPEGCFSTNSENQIHVRIIGWGQWATFFQRHLCLEVEQDFEFLEHKWGVPDYAASFSDKCNSYFDGLRLYPFVRRFNCTNAATYHSAVDDCFKVTVTSPQLVPAECWNYLWYTTTVAPFYAPYPSAHISDWHKHNPPPGTAYNSRPRMDYRSLTRQPDSEVLFEQLHELAPYDWNITYHILESKYHTAPTYEEATALSRPVLPYAYYAMETVAKTIQDQPEKYESLMAKAAEIDPPAYFTLGNYFKDRHEDDKAAKYYEKAFKLDLDAVQVANGAGWLVQYYLKNGRTNDASRLADFAGEVYSYSGLATKAQFLEDIGDYDGAFEWFWKIQDRYNDSGPLAAFCNRYKTKTGDTRFENELQRRMGNLFPNGIEKVSLGNFRSAPRDGVSINGENDLIRNVGMKSGDVIVAINGIRVHNFAQYSFEREMGPPEMDLIVWQGDAYHEIKASPPNHRFGVDFGDYSLK
jgi:tetratricopeptide (TPR) repeat protein